MSAPSRSAILAVIRAYQILLRPVLPPSCRFVPTCSEFAREAIERHGPLRGGRLLVGRLLRCQPLARGGFDPVR